MAKWTANDIPDLSGKTAVVTGANSGLGYETALALARHGASVVMACRDEGRGTEAVERLRTEAPDASVELSLLDLADLTSVRKFAESLAGERNQLDILVNNAGVMALPERRQTADGFEMQLGTNHFGHYALTGLLLPQLQARPGSRVVSVTSFGHKVGRMNFDDLQWEKSYRKWLAYGRSKLANLLFTFELDRRARAGGSAIIAAVAHPGYANTNLQSGTSFQWSNFMAQSSADGALPQLYAATAPDVQGGQFFGPGGFMEQRGAPKRVKAAKKAYDTEDARRLWELSEQLTGVTYSFGS
ncbi:MAG: SDR family oxidoreductase [Acidimicrobiia bacterium]|nr:SDR family oxidoreductase [Acidimicrobiia bacterium]MBV9042964.1 SDR family oxidoreductase [Acidimicrobiia bacterium]MBV9284982.1 SDR family oxidoreductase [Acidimicrobiia bacterium]